MPCSSISEAPPFSSCGGPSSAGWNRTALHRANPISSPSAIRRRPSASKYAHRVPQAWHHPDLFAAERGGGFGGERQIDALGHRQASMSARNAMRGPGCHLSIPRPRRCRRCRSLHPVRACAGVPRPVGGARLAVAEFRVLMDVAAPGQHLGLLALWQPQSLRACAGGVCARADKVAEAVATIGRAPGAAEKHA